MNGPLRRLAVSLSIGFALLVVAVSYVQVLAADTYRSDPRNERGAIARTGKQRGEIVAVDGTVLAHSVASPDDPQVYLRQYPVGPSFAHVVGYTSRLFGDLGLEATYADRLRSRSDLTISDLLTALLGGDLRPHRLQLTIDASLQQVAFEALAGQRGAVVAVDPATGAIRAMVSSPSFDPAALVGDEAAANWDALNADPLQPLRNRAATEVYAPASTFKLVVAAAAIDGGVATPETELPDRAELPLPGSTAVIRNFGGDVCGSGGLVSLQAAMVRSCNTVFAELALDVGAEPIGATAAAAGFNRSFDLPIAVAASVFPTDEAAADPAALAQSGIGERNVRATPLQMAIVAAAIANDGLVMTPYLVAGVIDADGNVVEAPEQEILDRAMAPATARLLGQMMERVVTEGTGRRAAVPGVRVAGKTGTTEGGEGSPDVWFVAFAPVEAPTIALAVFVEAGGEAGESATGGTVAAPIAQRVLVDWLEAGG